jgi:hypothetical protein
MEFFNGLNNGGETRVETLEEAEVCDRPGCAAPAVVQIQVEHGRRATMLELWLCRVHANEFAVQISACAGASEPR